MSNLEVSAISESELEQFFSDTSREVERAETQQHKLEVSTISEPELEQFFTEMGRQVEQAETQQRKLDREQTSGFNVFDFIEPDENKLSDVLAWLLDPEENHGQGGLFVGLLLKRLNLCSEATKTVKAKVHREAPTFGTEKYRRRMDVLVEAGALVVIENKLDSPEQPEQVKHYLEYLDRCTNGRPTKSVLVYLTPNGRKPTSLDEVTVRMHEENGRLKCWNYHVERRRWLEVCQRECEAEKIKYYLTDFLGYIEVELKRDSENPYEKDEDEN
jgi:hypothetical protein